MLKTLSSFGSLGIHVMLRYPFTDFNSSRETHFCGPMERNQLSASPLSTKLLPVSLAMTTFSSTCSHSLIDVVLCNPLMYRILFCVVGICCVDVKLKNYSERISSDIARVWSSNEPTTDRDRQCMPKMGMNDWTRQIADGTSKQEIFTSPVKWEKRQYYNQSCMRNTKGSEILVLFSLKNVNPINEGVEEEITEG